MAGPLHLFASPSCSAPPQPPSIRTSRSYFVETFSIFTVSAARAALANANTARTHAKKYVALGLLLRFITAAPLTARKLDECADASAARALRCVGAGVVVPSRARDV